MMLAILLMTWGKHWAEIFQSVAMLRLGVGKLNLMCCKKGPTLGRTSNADAIMKLSFSIMPSEIRTSYVSIALRRLLFATSFSKAARLDWPQHIHLLCTDVRNNCLGDMDLYIIPAVAGLVYGLFNLTPITCAVWPLFIRLGNKSQQQKGMMQDIF